MTDKFKQYTTVCYSGVELLKKHSLKEYGTWRINGEDPNCDFGGSHHRPFLGILEGELGDVIATAVEWSDFWIWGGGGSIEKTEVKKVETQDIKRRRRLILGDNLAKQTDALNAARQRVNELKKDILETEKALKELG